MDQEQELQRYDRQHDPGRLLALSDGVFAIILTLLVLEIHVPDLAQGRSLAEAMAEVRPSFVAFLISFVVVAISWAGHRDLFAHIRRTDRNLVWLNVLYLLPLSLLPFGAALLSRYQEEAVALRIYGLQLLVIALTRLVVWLYAVNGSICCSNRSVLGPRPWEWSSRGCRGALRRWDPRRRELTRCEPVDLRRDPDPVLHRGPRRAFDRTPGNGRGRLHLSTP